MPRTGGGLPFFRCMTGRGQRFAPHRRGSTRSLSLFQETSGVCPAQAGVYLLARQSQQPSWRLPRTGGGLPRLDYGSRNVTLFAPHRRGSTPAPLDHPSSICVCPAQAGVYPDRVEPGGGSECLPRTGGGLPFQAHPGGHLRSFAPHRRGSTPLGITVGGPGAVCPAQAGVYRH